MTDSVDAVRDITPMNVSLRDVGAIEASAGTGKTYALTTLVARLIVEERREIGDLLVVTFTVAATGELRDKVRATLRAALRLAGNEDPKPQDQAKRLLAQWEDVGIEPADAVRRLDQAVLDLDRANVMTIHGLCQRLLGDFAFDGGLPFAFEIAGDGLDNLRIAVRDEWCRRVHPASTLHVRYAKKGEFTPDALTEWAIGHLGKPDLEILGAEPWTAVDSDGLTELEEAWRLAVDEAKQAFDNQRDGFDVKTRTALEAAFERPEATVLGKEAYLGTKTARKKVVASSKTLAGQLDALDDAAVELRAAYDMWLRSSRLAVLENTRTAVARRVRETRQLGFDDLLTGVHDALCGPGGEGLVRRIRERYPWALIDEYQDTDRVQADIFRRIYRMNRMNRMNDGGANETGALIVVGDPKQSIYRFRSADIFAYLNARQDTAGKTPIRLARNYRSVPALTRAVNAVFEHPLPFALSEITFECVESAVTGVRLDIAGESDGQSPFQVRYVPCQGPKKWSKQDLLPVAASRAADEITELLKRASEGKATLGGEPLKGSDIAVLVRTTKQGRNVARELRLRGVSSVEIGDDNVLESDEADQLQRLLWAIAKPQSPHRVRGALAGDAFGLDAAQLAGLQDDDVSWNVWTERLEQWRAEWRRSGVAAMVRRLLASGEVQGAHHLLDYADGPRRLTNVMHLAELLQDAETQARLSPTGLAAWFSRRQANARRGEEVAQLRLDSDEQLVKIVTMHAAKGLEFPIVFCPFVWDGRKQQSRHWAAYHDRERAGYPELLHLAPTGIEHNKDWLEQFSDEARLLYVALTRARERCIVTWGHANQTENSALAWLLSDRNSKSPEEAASAFKSPNPKKWRARLDDLAERSAGGVSITEVDPSTTTRVVLPPVQAATELHARQPSRTPERIRQMTSYSALLHGAGAASTPDDHEAVEQPDRDEATVVTEQEGDAVPEENGTVRDAYTFPAGRRAGNCLHQIFERLDRGDNESLQDICRNSLDRYRIGDEWLEVAAALVENTRGCRLVADAGPGVDRGFRLAELTRPIPEMEFHLPLAGFDRRRFGETLAAHGYDDLFAGGRSAPIEGYLRGFIDLVAAHDDCFYVVDYKSNWLGKRAADYSRGRLDEAMAAHRYPLQYLLYLVALHRHLALRLPGYDYDKHVGGAFYLFLRGIDPESGMGRGVFFDRPAAACVEALDACFSGTS